jgi:hypothetical protein
MSIPYVVVGIVSKLLNMELLNQCQKLESGREERNKMSKRKQRKLQCLISAREKQLKRRNETKYCDEVLETVCIGVEGAERKGSNQNIENTCDREKPVDENAGIHDGVSEEHNIASEGQDIYGENIRNMSHPGNYRYDADDETIIDDDDNDDNFDVVFHCHCCDNCRRSDKYFQEGVEFPCVLEITLVLHEELNVSCRLKLCSITVQQESYMLCGECFEYLKIGRQKGWNARGNIHLKPLLHASLYYSMT